MNPGHLVVMYVCACPNENEKCGAYGRYQVSGGTVNGATDAHGVGLLWASRYFQQAVAIVVANVVVFRSIVRRCTNGSDARINARRPVGNL